MKKKHFILFFACLLALTTNAQYAYEQHDSKGKKTILSAIGIAGGITYGKQVWNPEGPYAQERWLLGFNGAVLAEFFHHPIYRWRTELGYNQLGTTELLYQPAGKKVVNRTNYISFNNYLKVVFKQEGFVPYLLVGPRVEYLLNEHAAIYQNLLSSFYKLHVTGSAGMGAEMIWKNPLRPFVELFYNHDIMVTYHYNGDKIFFPTDMIYRGYELRIGLKYFFDGLKKDVCPKVYNPAGN